MLKIKGLMKKFVKNSLYLESIYKIYAMYFKSENTKIDKATYIILGLLLAIYLYGSRYYNGSNLSLNGFEIFIVIIVYPVAILLILFIVRKLVNSYFI